MKRPTLSDILAKKKKGDVFHTVKMPVCKNCKKAKVEISSDAGKPLSRQSKYYGLCVNCRKRAKAVTELVKTTDNTNSELTICPGLV